MPHVSRNKLDKTTEAKLIHTLQVILSGISKEVEMDQFLVSLLSDTEQLMLAKRVAIILLLQQGNEADSVAKAIHVTRETVERLKIHFELNGNGYAVAFRVLESKKLGEDVKQMLTDLLTYAARAAGGRAKFDIF